MKNIVIDKCRDTFLRPGEVLVCQEPVVVRTVLGSCVAVTMYSPERNMGAICHAMLPKNPDTEENFLYVDSAVRHLHRRMTALAEKSLLIVKLFGGARILDAGGYYDDGKTSIGEENVRQAVNILQELDLRISRADVGGTLVRKLCFFIASGDVHLYRLRASRDVGGSGEYA